MTRVFALTSLTVLALASCGPAPQGAGFTGIGGEPVGLSSSAPSADARLMASQPGSTAASLPRYQVSSSSYNQAELANLAMAAGGRSASSANSVQLAGHKIMVSIAEVGGESFLVGRGPRSLGADVLEPGADKALLGGVTQLTGCHHQGKVYRTGRSQVQPEALAVPLSCG